jgi:hypothetical protein
VDIKAGSFFDQTGDYTQSFSNAAIAGVINVIIIGALYITINRRKAEIRR